MRKSRLVQAVAFSTLLSLSSACSTFKTPQPSYTYENQAIEEQIQRTEIQEPKEKPKTRSFLEGVGYWTLQLLGTAQYWIL